MKRVQRPVLIAALGVVAVAAVAGYLIGSGTALGTSDADRARDESFRAAKERTAKRVEEVTRRRGFATGLKRGRIAGEKVGLREAIKFGGGEAAVLMTESQIESARSSAAVARAEISARRPNCGVVARAPGWCPTSDELASFRAAVRAAREAREEEEKQKQRQERQGKGRRDTDE